jgi:LemA protein
MAYILTLMEGRAPESFMHLIIISVSLSIFLLVWIKVIYNSLIKEKNLIREALKGINVQLIQRHNLISNLVETVKGSNKYESELYQKISALRTGISQSENMNEKAKAESELSGVIKSLFSVVEHFPVLKTSQEFIYLQRKLSTIEEQIQYARRYYNKNVRDYNIEIGSFPGSIVAKIFDFKAEELFQFTLTKEKELAIQVEEKAEQEMETAAAASNLF